MHKPTYIFTWFVVMSFTFISLFIARSSGAGGTIHEEGDPSICIVGKTSDYTLDSIFGDTKDGDFAKGNCNAFYIYSGTQINADVVFFKEDPQNGGSDDYPSPTISEPISISLKKGRPLIIWGLPVPHQFILKNGCWGGFVASGTTGRTIRCKGGQEFKLDDWDQNKITVSTRNIPSGEYAFDVKGPGTLVLRDLRLVAACNQGMECGRIFRLSNGAKVVLQNTEIIAGYGITEGSRNIIFEVENSGGRFTSHVSFGKSDSTSDNINKISIGEAFGFFFHKPVMIHQGQFKNVQFDDYSGQFVQTDNPVWMIACKTAPDGKSCVIDNSGNSLSYVNALPQYKTLFIKKDAEEHQAEFVTGGKLEQEDDTNYRLTFPDGFDVDTFEVITNNGQKIVIEGPQKCPNGETPATNNDGSVTCEINGGHLVYDGSNWLPKCDDPLAQYNSATQTCECPQKTADNHNTNIEMVDGVCQPKGHYEWEKGDPKSGKADFECLGDAVPVYDVPYNDHSKDKVDRCTCAVGGGNGGYARALMKKLTWIGNVSKCENDIFKFIPSQDGDSQPSGDDGTQETDQGDTTSDSQDKTQTENNNLEKNCLDAGGTWRGLACDFPEQLTPVNNEESNSNTDAGIVSGCSLVSSSETVVYPFWIVFMAIPILSILTQRKRVRKLRD
jgi:hypothetical protein